MIRTLACLLALTACKGESKSQGADPQAAQQLDSCQRNLDEKDKLIKDLKATNEQLQKEKVTGGEVVVSIEGDVLKIKHNAGAGGGPIIDDKVASAATKAFVDVVSKSRGAIQKCYEQALKKDSALQSHTVTVVVSASFAPSGQNRDSSVSPPINDTFDKCIKTVASKWTVPQNSPVSTFRAPVSLTPS